LRNSKANEPKNTVIVYGNCQAEAVCVALQKDPLASKLLSIVYSSSFDNPNGMGAEVADEDIADCVLLYEQHDPRTFPYRDRLPENCYIVEFPAVDLNLLWPFNCVNPYNAPDPPVFPFGRFPYGDRVIVAAIDQDVPPDEILDYYLNGWDQYKPDLDRLLALESARLDARDTPCDIRMAPYVMENFRKHRLFWAINHPANTLLEEIVERLLNECGRINPTLADADIASTLATYFGPYGPLGAVSIPIHPRVAEHFSLEWYNLNDKFRSWDGALYSYTEYFDAMIRESYAVKRASQPA